MQASQQLLRKITNLTSVIASKYPELYRYLEENPITIPTEANPNVQSETLKKYLDSLKSLLAQFKNTRKMKMNNARHTGIK